MSYVCLIDSVHKKMDFTIKNALGLMKYYGSEIGNTPLLPYWFSIKPWAVKYSYWCPSLLFRNAFHQSSVKCGIDQHQFMDVWYLLKLLYRNWEEAFRSAQGSLVHCYMVYSRSMSSVLAACAGADHVSAGNSHGEAYMLQAAYSHMWLDKCDLWQLGLTYYNAKRYEHLRICNHLFLFINCYF